MKLWKAALGTVFSFALAVILMPILPAGQAWAGGGWTFPDSKIQGVNKAGTDSVNVDPGATITITFSDLDEAGIDFSNAYHDGQVTVYWRVSSSETGSGEQVKPTYKDKSFVLEVEESYAGKYLTFFLDGAYNGENYNNNCTPIKVNALVPTLADKPEVSNIQMAGSLLNKNVTVSLSGRGRYYTVNNSNKTEIANTEVVLYLDGTKVGSKTTDVSTNRVTFSGVYLPYNKAFKLKVELYVTALDKRMKAATTTKDYLKQKLAKNAVTATKLDANKVALRWNDIEGANGYDVYMGSKKVKTLGVGKVKYTVKKKGAAKAKFKVKPYATGKTKKYAGTSNAAKPSANQVKLNHSTGINSASYATCPFRVTKISLSGSTYTITGYAVNNRIFKMQKYKKLKIQVWVDGKIVLKKTVKNKTLNVGASKSKKVVLKLKGKAGADLAHGIVTDSTSTTPVWKM